MECIRGFERVRSVDGEMTSAEIGRGIFFSFSCCLSLPSCEDSSRRVSIMRLKMMLAPLESPIQITFSLFWWDVRINCVYNCMSHGKDFDAGLLGARGAEMIDTVVLGSC